MARRLILFAALYLAVAPLAAVAAEHEGAPEQPVGQYVDLSSIAFPIVYQGRLINYVFATVRVNLVKSANATALREKEPFFRDALVRLAHRRPFTRLDDFTSIDEAALKAAFAPEAARIAGGRQVSGVEVMSQAAKAQFGLPKPPQPRRPAPPPKPAAH